MLRRAYNFIDRFDASVSEIIFAIPLVLLTVLIYRVIIRKRLKKILPGYKQALKSARLNEVVTTLFIAWAAGAAFLTVLPSGFCGNFWGVLIFQTFPPFELPHSLRWKFVPAVVSYAVEGVPIPAPELWHLVLNALLYVPFGLLFPFVWKKANFGRTMLFGFACTLVIETVQPFFRRDGDIDDVICNTLGVLIGYLFYLLIKKLFPRFIDKSKVTVKEFADS